MKKILLPLFSLLFFQSKATTWNVDVQNFQFSPANADKPGVMLARLIDVHGKLVLR